MGAPDVAEPDLEQALRRLAVELDIADRTYVLENGSLRFEGTPQQLLASAELKRAYLGV